MGNRMFRAPLSRDLRERASTYWCVQHEYRILHMEVWSQARFSVSAVRYVWENLVFSGVTGAGCIHKRGAHFRTAILGRETLKLASLPPWSYQMGSIAVSCGVKLVGAPCVVHSSSTCRWTTRRFPL